MAAGIVVGYLLGGGNQQTNYVNDSQSVTNNILQLNQQSCIATVQQNVTGNVVYFNGGSIQGNATGIDVTSTSTDATCLISSDMDNNITNILSAIAQQSNSTDSGIFGGLGATKANNTFDVQQSTVNNISQVNQALCQASTINNVVGNYVYYNNTNVGGNFVGISVADTSATANCTMNNYQKNTLYNSEQARSDQSNKKVSALALLIIVIALIIGLVVVGMFVIFGISAIKKSGTGKAGVGVGGVPGQPGMVGVPVIAAKPGVGSIGGVPGIATAKPGGVSGVMGGVPGIAAAKSGVESGVSGVSMGSIGGVAPPIYRPAVMMPSK